MKMASKEGRYTYLTLSRNLREELLEMTAEVPREGMAPSRKEHEAREFYTKLLRDPLALF